MEMLHPAWMKGPVVSDIKAVLKRTNIVIATERVLYYRPATEEEMRIESVRLDDAKSLLRQSGGLKYVA